MYRFLEWQCEGALQFTGISNNVVILHSYLTLYSVWYTRASTMKKHRTESIAYKGGGANAPI
jgi:hypothetical protein